MMKIYQLTLQGLFSIVVLLLASCSGSSKDKELAKYIKEVKSRPPRAIEPIPEYKPLPKFTFPENVKRRSPFKPAVDSRENQKLAPNLNRPKQPLEAYSLDSLKFVGILKRGNVIWALMADPTGKINRVRVGNYIGKNYGKILRITDKSIELEETFRVGGLWEKKVTTINLYTKK